MSAVSENGIESVLPEEHEGECRRYIRLANLLDGYFGSQKVYTPTTRDLAFSLYDALSDVHETSQKYGERALDLPSYARRLSAYGENKDHGGLTALVSDMVDTGYDILKDFADRIKLMINVSHYTGIEMIIKTEKQRFSDLGYKLRDFPENIDKVVREAGAIDTHLLTSRLIDKGLFHAF